MKIKTVLIQHVEEEELGILPEVLLSRNHSISQLRAWDDIEAEATNAELLILLGGPISANQEDLFPFISKEIAILRKRIEQGLPTLGICLGAQLLAKAAGAQVYRMKTQEFGWSPLQFSDKGNFSCLRHLEKVPVFHWHEEAFDLPFKGERLASTFDCANQAFSIGKAILGVQFHLEINEKKIQLLTAKKDSSPSFLKDLNRRTEICLHEWLGSLNL